MSSRQFFCAFFAVAIAAGLYFLLGNVLGKETASWLCILAAAPVAISGFFSYNDLTLEQFLWAVLKTEILCAGNRKFISENIYYKFWNRKEALDFD